MPVTQARLPLRTPTPTKDSSGDERSLTLVASQDSHANQTVPLGEALSTIDGNAVSATSETGLVPSASLHTSATSATSGQGSKQKPARQLKPLKKKNAFISFLTLREPSTAALEEFADSEFRKAAIKAEIKRRAETAQANPAEGVERNAPIRADGTIIIPPGFPQKLAPASTPYKDRKLPPEVPMVNSKWDGMPSSNLAQQRQSMNSERSSRRYSSMFRKRWTSWAGSERTLNSRESQASESSGSFGDPAHALRALNGEGEDDIGQVAASGSSQASTNSALPLPDNGVPPVPEISTSFRLSNNSDQKANHTPLAVDYSGYRYRSSSESTPRYLPEYADVSGVSGHTVSSTNPKQVFCGSSGPDILPPPSYTGVAKDSASQPKSVVKGSKRSAPLKLPSETQEVHENRNKPQSHAMSSSTSTPQPLSAIPPSSTAAVGPSSLRHRMGAKKRSEVLPWEV